MQVLAITFTKLFISISNLKKMQDSPQTKPPKAKEIFSAAQPDIQTLIREVLREERDVQHMKTKSEIHVKIYEHIRRIIK